MKKLLLIFVSTILSIGLPLSALAAVAYDNAASAYCSNQSPPICASDTTLSYTITVGNNPNRQLGVDVFVGCNSGETAPAISSVTDTEAGVTLTQTASVNPNASRRGYRYRFPAGSQPTVGTNTIVVTLSSPLTNCNNSAEDDLTSWALSAYNVDQTTPDASTPATNSGSGTSATVTGFTSGANDLGMSGMCSGTETTGTTETQRTGPTGTSHNACGAVSGATAAGGDTSFSWTLPSDSWTTIGSAFKEVSAAPSGTTSFTVRDSNFAIRDSTITIRN